MENLVSNPWIGCFRGRRVFITGHTGFKGSWLCEWLLMLGAEITGYSLPPPTTPALFEQLALKNRITSVLGDVRDQPALQAALKTAKPEFIFHLAAQSLVIHSYQRPLETFEVNLLGTANLLESIRRLELQCTVVIVTTDKCYENQETSRSYRETDPLGGHDPYSASKAGAELISSSYRSSFFSAPDSSVRLATARAGNVIGGGDWAEHRILPDCIRALKHHLPISLRNPHATRPWQHVLEPLCGYLTLAAALDSSPDPQWRTFASAFNFGPLPESHRTVGELTQTVLKYWPGSYSDLSLPQAPHEAGLLHLDIDRAAQLLRWQPRWDFDHSVAQTVSWYREMSQNPTNDPAHLTRQQIEAYASACCT